MDLTAVFDFITQAVLLSHHKPITSLLEGGLRPSISRRLSLVVWSAPELDLTGFIAAQTKAKVTGKRTGVQLDQTKQVGSPLSVKTVKS